MLTGGFRAESWKSCLPSGGACSAVAAFVAAIPKSRYWFAISDQGSCHCGNMRIGVPSKPTWVADCNCSLCRRTAWRVAYFSPGPSKDFRRDDSVYLGRPNDRHSPLSNLRLRYSLVVSRERLRQNGHHCTLARQFRRKYCRGKEIRQFGKLGPSPQSTFPNQRRSSCANKCQNSTAFDGILIASERRKKSPQASVAG